MKGWTSRKEPLYIGSLESGSVVSAEGTWLDLHFENGLWFNVENRFEWAKNRYGKIS